MDYRHPNLIEESHEKLNKDNASFDDTSPRTHTNVNRYQMTAIKRPKSSLQPGRQPFKGRLFALDEYVDRGKSQKKGQKMEKFNMQLRESNEKVSILVSF